MKTLKLVVFGIALFFAGAAQAQVSIRLNIGSPPSWGPVGYGEARYYYLPDVEAYYDVQTSMFIYYEGRSWVHRTYLPRRYRNYDLYGGYKVVMNDYHGKTPYAQFNMHKRQYARGYHQEAQRTIGDRPGRGNSGSGNYRKTSQEYNGHGSEVGKNDKRNDDNSYDRKGNKKNDRGNRKDKGK